MVDENRRLQNQIDEMKKLIEQLTSQEQQREASIANSSIIVDQSEEISSIPTIATARKQSERLQVHIAARREIF